MEDIAPGALPSNEHSRSESESKNVTTRLAEWPAGDLATLVERLGDDPYYFKIAKTMRDAGADGLWAAEQPGATATVDAILKEMKEDPKLLGTIKMDRLLGLFRQLRANPEAERSHARSIGMAARGLHLKKSSSSLDETFAAKLVVLGERLAHGTLVTTRGTRCIALVVCLAAYVACGPLRKSVHDGLDMQDFLTRMGFEVIFVQDGTKVDIERRINEFIAMLEPGVVALAFYAGYAVEIEGAGYLVPIDFAAQDAVQAKHDAISLPLLIEKMSRTAAVIRIVIVDACCVPLPGTRGVSSDLQLPSPPVGGVVLFATSPGATASDGKAGGRNGLFTEHLLKTLQQPVTLLEAFLLVVRQVSIASSDRQRPQTVHDLTNDFCFRADIEPSVPSRMSNLRAPAADVDGGERAPIAGIPPSMLLLVVVLPDAVVAGHARGAALYEENTRAIAEQMFENRWLAKRRCKAVLSATFDGDPRDLTAENIIIVARGYGWTPSTIQEVSVVTGVCRN